MLVSCSMADKHWSKKFEANKNGLARYKNDYIQHDSIEFLHVSITYYVFTWEDTTGRSAKINVETVPYQLLDTHRNRTYGIHTKIKVVHRIKLFKQGGWIITHGYYLIPFHSEIQIVHLIFEGGV